MATPTLTTEQKDALFDLMNAYFDAMDYFEYQGKARRESYAYANTVSPDVSTPDATQKGSMNSSTKKYFLNCGLFAQMIWMGRKISDFTSHTSTPIKTIAKEFSWGYYFDFAQAQNAYGKTKGETKYNLNTYENASGSRVFITFDNAASMAEELYEKGYEIPYSEADVGDLVFYRAESLIDGDKDQLEESSCQNISHVAIVNDVTADGVPILIECTSNMYSKGIMGDAEL